MGKLIVAQQSAAEAERRFEKNGIQVLVITANDDLGRLIEAILEDKEIPSRQVEPDGQMYVFASQCEIKTIFFDPGCMLETGPVIDKIRQIRSHFQSKLACLIPPSRPDAKLLCLAAGADVILEKPINADDLYRETGKVYLPCERKLSSGGS